MIITRYAAKLDQDKGETNFNYFLSSYRVHIEQSFGMLVSKWRILRKKLSYSVRKSVRAKSACLKLHNYVIENDRAAGKRDDSYLQLQSNYRSSLLWYTEKNIAMRWVRRRHLEVENIDYVEVDVGRVELSNCKIQREGRNAVQTREKLTIIVKEHGLENFQYSSVAMN